MITMRNTEVMLIDVQQRYTKMKLDDGVGLSSKIPTKKADYPYHNHKRSIFFLCMVT